MLVESEHKFIGIPRSRMEYIWQSRINLSCRIPGWIIYIRISPTWSTSLQKMPYIPRGLPFLGGKKQQDPMNPSVDLVTCGMGGFSSSLSGKGGAPEAKSASDADNPWGFLAKTMFRNKTFKKKNSLQSMVDFWFLLFKIQTVVLWYCVPFHVSNNTTKERNIWIPALDPSSKEFSIAWPHWSSLSLSLRQSRISGKTPTLTIRFFQNKRFRFLCELSQVSCPTKT